MLFLTRLLINADCCCIETCSGALLEGREMLVLSRRKSESIVINDDVIITIVEVRGDKVRLGIQAPRDVPVHRKEVLDAIMRENQGEASPSEEA